MSTCFAIDMMWLCVVLWLKCVYSDDRVKNSTFYSRFFFLSPFEQRKLQQVPSLCDEHLSLWKWVWILWNSICKQEEFLFRSVFLFLHLFLFSVASFFFFVQKTCVFSKLKVVISHTKYECWTLWKHLKSIESICL